MRERDIHVSRRLFSYVNVLQYAVAVSYYSVVLQCVALCVLQCVVSFPVRRSLVLHVCMSLSRERHRLCPRTCVLQCAAVSCSLLQRVAECHSVLQSVAVCCSVLQSSTSSVHKLALERYEYPLSSSSWTETMSLSQLAATHCNCL